MQLQLVVVTSVSKFSNIENTKHRDILSRKLGKWRRCIWFLMIICGITYSLKMIAKCAINFFKYPASIKPNLNSKDVVRFPKVTICLNGMHSSKKIEEKYPGYGPVIRELYTGRPLL